jgi:hypothetical protein
MSSMTVKKAIWLGILTPILGWCAWVAWVVFNIDPNPRLYPPIAHADGSKEYRLIHREFDPSDPLIADTSTDQHWVLRFPAELAVSSLDENRTEAQKRENTDYPYNLNLDFSVGLPIFELTPNTRDIPRDDVLHVRVSAGEVRFGTGTDTSPHDTFFAQHQQRTEYSCRKDTEVFPGIVSLREPSTQEIEKLGKKPLYSARSDSAIRYYPFPPSCTQLRLRHREEPHGYMFRPFAVYDDADAPLGYGQCPLTNTQPQDFKDEWLCSFWFWIPQERVVMMTFSAKYLGNIKSLHTRVIDLLIESTDHDKSIRFPDLRP